MAGKPNTHNWNDVQLVIASVSILLTLVFWNLFAGPDRVRAMNSPTATAAAETALPQTALVPTPLPEVKILFGSSAPGTVSVAAAPAPRKNRGGGGGGGGGGTGGS